MGTLFKQDPRKSFNVSKSDVEEFLEEVKTVARESNINIPDVIETYRVLENRRRNNLYHYNGDVFDEQIAGIGEIFKDFVEHIESISSTNDDLVGHIENIAGSLEKFSELIETFNEHVESIATSVDNFERLK